MWAARVSALFKAAVPAADGQVQDDTGTWMQSLNIRSRCKLIVHQTWRARVGAMGLS